jgi:hypothetical protein
MSAKMLVNTRLSMYPVMLFPSSQKANLVSYGILKACREASQRLSLNKSPGIQSKKEWGSSPQACRRGLGTELQKNHHSVACRNVNHDQYARNSHIPNPKKLKLERSFPTNQRIPRSHGVDKAHYAPPGSPPPPPAPPAPNPPTNPPPGKIFPPPKKKRAPFPKLFGKKKVTLPPPRNPPPPTKLRIKTRPFLR